MTRPSTADDFVLGRYRYNGLHWRVWKQANLSAAPAAMTGAGGGTPSVTWGDLQHYLTDAQFSVVAVMDAARLPGYDILERVKYTPYGFALHCPPGDYNGGGYTNWVDYSVDFAGQYGSGTLMSDFNRSGTRSSDDVTAFATAWYAADPDAPESSGWVSHPDAASGGHDNTIGYCGYVFNPETGDYTVRFRAYMPSLGRWGERDPLGYVEGTNHYLYVSAAPTLLLDTFGLMGDASDPVEMIHPYPLYLGGDPNQTCVEIPRSKHRCGEDSQHAFIRNRLGGGDTDAQRAAWKKLTPDQRKAIIRDSLKKVGVDRDVIKKHLDDFVDNDKPGINRSRDRSKRSSCAKVINVKGKVLTGVLGIIAFYAAAHNVGAVISEDPNCQEVRRIMLEFDKDPSNCELLSSGRSALEQCFLSVGTEIGEHQGGITASGALDQWDKALEKCTEERRKRDNCCGQDKKGA